MLQPQTDPPLPSISPSSLLPVPGQAQPLISNSRSEIKAQMVQIQKQMQHMFEDVKDNIQNKSLQRNNCIFGVLMILLQIGITVFYGFLIKVYDRQFQVNLIKDQNQLKYASMETFQPVAISLLTFVIVVIGFGCLFAYHRKLLWSTLTYNLLIVCLTVQIYPIVNYVINIIRNNGPDGFLFLSNYQQYTYTNVNIDSSLIQKYQKETVGKCLLDSLKCSISNCVVFSAILGRAGLLDSLLVSVFATIAYQINKQILSGLGVDFADANSMFTFGGFCGLGIGLIVYIKNKLFRTRCNKNKNYTGSLFSVALSIFGCALLLALFPILVLHYPQNWEIITPTILSTAPYCVYSSMAASTMMSIGASIIINKKTIVRDLINGTIAGGIAILNSCPFIIVPAYAQIVGAFAGLLQVFVANFIQKRIARDKQIVTTFSFCLFGVQGVVGAAFASLWRIITISNPGAYGSDWSNYISNSWRVSSSYPIAFAGISAGIGFGVGVVIGLVISLLSTYRRSDSMHDSVGFKVRDGQNFKQFESQIEEQMNKQQQLGPVMIPFK